MILFPFGETVTLVTRTRTGIDSNGLDIFALTSATLTNVPVWPRTSTELVQGQDQVAAGLTALLPAGTDVTAIDKVTVYGADYEIDGDPARYASPFTGMNPGIEINLKKVTG